MIVVNQTFCLWCGRPSLTMNCGGPGSGVPGPCPGLSAGAQKSFDQWKDGKGQLDIKEAEESGGGGEFNQMLDQLPKYQGEAFRGLSGISEEFRSQLAFADEITLPTSQAASKSEAVGRSFAEEGSQGENLLLRIASKSAADLTPFDKEFANEKEVILRKGSRYRINRKKSSNLTKIRPGQLGIVYLEEI